MFHPKGRKDRLYPKTISEAPASGSTGRPPKRLMTWYPLSRYCARARNGPHRNRRQPRRDRTSQAQNTTPLRLHVGPPSPPKAGTPCAARPTGGRAGTPLTRAPTQGPSVSGSTEVRAVQRRGPCDAHQASRGRSPTGSSNRPTPARSAELEPPAGYRWQETRPRTRKEPGSNGENTARPLRRKAERGSEAPRGGPLTSGPGRLARACPPTPPSTPPILSEPLLQSPDPAEPPNLGETSGPVPSTSSSSTGSTPTPAASVSSPRPSRPSHTTASPTATPSTPPTGATSGTTRRTAWIPGTYEATITASNHQGSATASCNANVTVGPDGQPGPPTLGPADSRPSPRSSAGALEEKAGEQTGEGQRMAPPDPLPGAAWALAGLVAVLVARSRP